MTRTFYGRSRILGILVVAAALATGAYAFTATNTVPDSNAGSGSGTISGYTVSGIAYTLNATTPSNIDSLTFTLNAAATTVEGQGRQRLDDVHELHVTGGVNVTCDFAPDIAITTADQLSVIATS